VSYCTNVQASFGLVCITGDILKLSRASFPVFTLRKVKLLFYTLKTLDSDRSPVPDRTKLKMSAGCSPDR